MDNGTQYVKGQQVITPAGEGSVEEVTDDRITVRLTSGGTQTFDSGELEDNSDAG